MPTTVTFNYTGAAQTFVVPAGVTAVTVDLYGAEGGSGSLNNSPGGAGGRCQGTFAVTPGETLQINVGQAGSRGGNVTFNGGGAGSTAAGGAPGGSGGGGTDVRRGGTALSNRVAVAGGGGGGAGFNNGQGGVGGGLNGGNGVSGSLNGGGGSQTAGFALGQGGSAGANDAGGGGGGGFWGGQTAQPGSSSTGGGGSALVPSGGTTTSGVRTGDGAAVLTYNQPPAVPGAFTAPTAGQVVNTTATVTFGAGSDPDGDAVTYDVQLSSDNGATWTQIFGNTSSRSFVYDFTNVPASTATILRARSRDTSNLTSAFVNSPTFTVQHNVAPAPPTLLAPVGNASIDRTAVQRFSWQFNDPDAGDSQSKYDLRYRIVGAPSWTTVTTITSAQLRDFAANTFAAGSYEWQVQTYDAQGLASGYSSSGFFTAATPPAGPTILQPVNNFTVSTSSGVVEWSYPTQQAYQVRKVADAAGSPDTATVYFDTGIVENAAARTVALTYPTNNRSEHVQVRVRDAGLWSPYSSVRVSVSFTPPAVPDVTVVSGASTITVTVSNPTPTGTQPAVVSSDIWRRVTAEGGDGIRIAKDLPASAVYVDRTPASGVEYEYAVVVRGANGTVSGSEMTGGGGVYRVDYEGIYS